MVVDEKQPVDNGDLTPEPSQYGPVNERKLMAKIDWHVVPCLCLMYLLAFLDRVNISNAAVLGLESDLHITTGTKYNTALTIFFVPYIIFEIPSNVLMKKLKPHTWLSLCMFGFGLVMVCQGFVQNWGGLMATRWFLGMFETGLFPGCFYLLGMWYKRSEAQKRFSFFFSSTTLAGAFGGLLASGLGKMDGVRGLAGWRWVFIIEGIITCVVAMGCFFVVPDFPEDVKWLTPEEREFLRDKLAQDAGKSAVDVKTGWRDILAVFKDYKIFIGGWMYFGQVVTAYGYAYFAPTIIKTFGYGAIKTQFYSIPPWAAAFGFSMCIAYLSDRFQHRFLFTLLPMLVAMAGFGILINIHSTSQHHIQYGALFLVTSGCYSAMPVLVCWFAMNLGGHRRRSVGTAWQIGFGNIGGIISTYSFLSKDAPFYRNGYIIGVSFLAFSAAMSCLYFLAIWHDNRKRDRAIAEGTVDLNAISEAEEEYMGDMAPTYRYAY
ncbi:MFS general substrate transporter [Aspergillus brunneoviolaceus CBS 621.78]|uniref:MFS general substrate transporter n=1 Tax=Aspergillus brunneoviolaceus CBS 621.78 TaxID=1450534 RepID=A0ACD1GFB1_9EURO|nr:MFS general substrate transporter [Aspergillus brunneoviolaceus CBS 621.78]RAH47915.1 MFS general substrate transporter [Aspergillus brunneoviolaceus CBS 621.78]